MPHFENLDQYETTNAKSGKKEIVPIAPHSLQKSDYRPRLREQGHKKVEKAVPDFPEVEIEPISVQQMEKEFRMAGRTLRRSRGKHKKSLFRRVLKWFRKLFGGKGSKKKSHKGSTNRRRRPKQGKKPSGQQGARNPQGKSQPGKEGQQSGNRRRRRRRPSGSGSGQGSRQGSNQGSSQGSKQESRPRSQGSGNSGGDGDQARGQKRRRRRSRRPGGPSKENPQ